VNGEIINIPWYSVMMATVFVAASGACSLYLGLKLEKDILIGTIRTFLQLFLLGYVLKIVFAMNNPIVVTLLFAFMILFAARIITGRVKEKSIPYYLPVLGSMFLSYMLINFIVMDFIIRVRPWYSPVYFIPVGGMIIGNSMNAIAISLNNWFNDLKKERERIELFLALGANPAESTQGNFRESVTAGMIPSINALMSVGVVSIPGMMTGQILAGTDPMIAIKYQIVIMLLLVGSTALSTVFALAIVRRLSFTHNQQLKM
jgi:putative ABC transport system permease protein